MKRILLVFLTLVGLAIGAWFFFMSVHSPLRKEDVPYVAPPLTQEYQNETYRFSLRMPADFSAKEFSEDGNDYVVFEDTEGHGIQIMLSPYKDGGANLTVTDLQILDPSLTILSPEAVELGEVGGGVAFLSDNAAFDGASREVWFIFRGTLYQISTYAKFDSLLKAIFATWSFF